MSLSISAGPEPAYQIPLYLRNPAGSAEGEEKRPGMFYATLGRPQCSPFLWRAWTKIFSNA